MKNFEICIYKVDDVNGIEGNTLYIPGRVCSLKGGRGDEIKVRKLEEVGPDAWRMRVYAPTQEEAVATAVAVVKSL